MKPILYFIALIPPENISSEIISIKEDFARRFQSKAALKVVPHITLKAPFKLLPSQHEKLFHWFRTLRFSENEIPIDLNNFGTFAKEKAPVIYIMLVVNDTLLSFQKELITQFKTTFPEIEISRHEEDFHPHITIGYRDLKPDMYQQAWKEYQHKKYHAQFIAGTIYLLQHDEQKWNIISEKKLSSPAF